MIVKRLTYLPGLPRLRRQSQNEEGIPRCAWDTLFNLVYLKTFLFLLSFLDWVLQTPVSLVSHTSRLGLSWRRIPDILVLFSSSSIERLSVFFQQRKRRLLHFNRSSLFVLRCSYLLSFISRLLFCRCRFEHLKPLSFVGWLWWSVRRSKHHSCCVSLALFFAKKASSLFPVFASVLCFLETTAF